MAHGRAAWMFVSAQALVFAVLPCDTSGQIQPVDDVQHSTQASNANVVESSAPVGSQESLMAPDAHVRGVTSRLVMIIHEATAQSDTFRGLVDQISQTNGVVYVAEGECGHGVQACLVPAMTTMGPNRVLRILVDGRRADRDLMGSIGHELQHVVEVLSRRSIRTYSAMILLYKELCDACGPRFETDDAVRAGNAVRDELRKSAQARAK